MGHLELEGRSTRALAWGGALLALLVLFVSRAQAVDSYAPIGPYTPPGLETPRPELHSVVDSVNLDAVPQPQGIAFGKLKLNPYISFDELHSDNARRTPNHEVDDDLLSYDVGFTSQFRPQECVRAVLNYDFGWHQYVRGTERDYPTQQANCQVSVDRVGVDGMSLLFYDNFQLTSSTGELENEIQQFEKYHTNLTGMTAQYKFNRFKIGATYEYNFFEYAAKAASVADYRTDSGKLEAAWQWLPNRLEIFDSYRIQKTLFAHAVASDFDTDTFLAGVRGKYSKLTYSVGVGYEFARPMYKRGVKGDVGYNASIAYAPHRRIGVEVTASRAFQAGVLTGSALETDVAANLNLKLTRRGTFSLGYVRNQSDRLDGVHQISVAYSPHFEYKLARRVSLTTGYARIERSSTDAATEFKIDEVKLGVKLSW